MKQFDTEGQPEKPIYLPGSHISLDLTVIDHLGGSDKVDVYLCRSKQLKRLVACKMLLPEGVADDTTREGLLSEGKILQQLRHPNIIEGYGLYQEPLPNLVMEYLEGQDLETVFFEGNYECFGVKDFAEVAVQLSDALSYMHSQGFLHLDVKPSNIIYRDGNIKLLDFSLALPYSPDKLLKHRSGTIDYMAPEQTFHEPLTPASDVFGMGVTFYQLLTGGKLPYRQIDQDDDDGIFCSRPDYNSPVQLPSQINLSVNKSLDTVVLKAIRPDVKERFQTSAAFKTALLAAL